MNHEFRLADIGEGLEEAEILTWLVAVGDRVDRDQPLVEVMTDKSNAELPAPISGTVIGLSGDVGDIIHVGGLIAVIEGGSDAGNASPATDVASSALTSPEPAPASSNTDSINTGPTTTAPASALPSSGRPKASPSTRRAAAQQGIDLATIAGTGPGGRILLSDLSSTPAAISSTPTEAQAEALAWASQTEPASAPTPAPAPLPPPPAAPVTPVAPAAAAGEVVPLRGVRRAVAQNMARAWAEVPHIHSFAHIDAEPMLDLRERLKATGKSAYASVTPLSFFVAAVTRALLAHPVANASIDMQTETITHHRTVNVGVAVAAPHGLVVPVLKDAGSLGFEALTRQLRELVAGARAGSLAPKDYQEGTVTITNFGSLGGEQAVPIIRAPEAMILGFGSVAARPFVINDEVVARKTMHLVAGADHRLLDGDVTTAVLSSIGESLTDPLRLVL